ncbi:hypothetical protein Hanom_Chr03g00265511 [Helianthus anomalus]
MRGLIFASSKSASPSNSFAQTSSMSTHSHHRTFSVSITEEDLLYAEQIIKRLDLDSPFFSLSYLPGTFKIHLVVVVMIFLLIAGFG